jgi:glycolate oxidase FAD binding subunit
VISADTDGSARLRAGAVRDHLLGLHAVNGLGEIFRGGSRVVKNVTGFDVPKLVCGAMGTLCVLTEVTLRIFPKPSRSIVLAAEGVGIEDGFAALRKVWTCPLEATGLAFLPAPPGDSILIRLEGEHAPLEEKISHLRALLAKYDLKEVEGGEGHFKAIASGALLPKDAKAVWRVVLPPASAAKLVKLLSTSQWVADWAGGLFWIAAEKVEAGFRKQVSDLGGHAILVRGEGDVFPPLDPVLAKMNMSVKQAFDPDGVLNPGRLYEGQ